MHVCVCLFVDRAVYIGGGGYIFMWVWANPVTGTCGDSDLVEVNFLISLCSPIGNVYGTCGGGVMILSLSHVRLSFLFTMNSLIQSFTLSHSQSFTLSSFSCMASFDPVLFPISRSIFYSFPLPRSRKNNRPWQRRWVVFNGSELKYFQNKQDKDYSCLNTVELEKMIDVKRVPDVSCLLLQL